jgi:hypothetical protein
MPREVSEAHEVGLDLASVRASVSLTMRAVSPMAWYKTAPTAFLRLLSRTSRER